MAEGNGNESDARKEKLGRGHEEFRADLKLLLTAQVIQKTQIEDLLKVTQEHTRQMKAEEVARREIDAVLDARVDKLVSAASGFISRLPAP